MKKNQDGKENEITLGDDEIPEEIHFNYDKRVQIGLRNNMKKLTPLLFVLMRI